MGYTHYWVPKKVSKNQFKDFSRACKALYNALPSDIEIVYEYDRPNEKPLFRNDEVWFNGKGENGHETFVIKHNTDSEFDFCKTARKPYDLLVCSCLLAASEFLGYEVSTDGEYEDWKPAIELYLKTIYSSMPDLKPILPEKIFDQIGITEKQELSSIFDKVRI